ncbi:MAG TPA: response regulator [Phototrophicaceae bacterium]|nr:response regulator [Phototrophicaceae bacterium]
MPKSGNTAIITDQQAEGSPQSREARESVRGTQSIPMLRQSSLRNAPAAETGVVAAVRVTGEGTDDSDTQDASRTLAETQLSPNRMEATMQLSALIVEDTLELAEILQVTLQRMHIVTAHESHASRAAARFKEMQPDLVLLDIGLPDGPGWKVLDSIKEQQRAKGGKLPVVIVITAYGDPANRLVGKLHGVYSYLIKPFTPHEVERIIKDALGSAAG